MRLSFEMNNLRINKDRSYEVIEKCIEFVLVSPISLSFKACNLTSSELGLISHALFDNKILKHIDFSYTSMNRCGFDILLASIISIKSLESIDLSGNMRLKWIRPQQI